MKVVIKKASSPGDLQACMSIRKTVFVHGQNVPLQEEIDGKDEGSDHYLLVCDELPVGVARVRFIGNIAKIERVAILDDYQGRGFGNQIMQAILADLQGDSRLETAKLSSQTYAIPFYEKLGFIICSGEYLDAGIPHQDMQLSLDR